MSSRSLKPFHQALRAAFDAGYRVVNNQVLTPTGYRRTVAQKTRYLIFTFYWNKKSYPIPVHRLLAYQIYGDRLFTPGMEVRHRNHDRSDNRPSNIFIELGPRNHQSGPRGLVSLDPPDTSENLEHTLPPPLTPEIIQSIKRDHQEGAVDAAIMLRYNVSRSTVFYAVNDIL